MVSAVLSLSAETMPSTLGNILGNLICIFFLFSGCSATSERSRAVGRGNPEIFRVGEIEVRLYQDRETMMKDLPAFLALLEATRAGDKRVRINGYYDKQNKRIYSIDDARIVIHEFKHYLEPDWRHGIETSGAETSHLELSHR
jgi:hypothetical protein